MNGYGRFIVIAFAVILIALYPLQYIAQSQSDTIEDIVNAKATEFTDKARHQGYITVDEYEDFIGDLDSTGELYDITIEATHPVSGKELAEANVGEDVSDLSIKNSSLTTIKNTSLTAIKNTSLTTESNHMFHISSERNTKENWNNLNRNIAEPMYSALGAGITLFAVHTHTTDCYAGHNHAASGCSYHTHSGSSTSGGGCYGVANYHSHASSCWGSSTCGGSVNISVYSTNSGYCSACKKNVSGITYAKRCSVCGQSYGNVWVLSCGHGSSVPSSFACTNSISKLICSIDITKPISYSLSCSLYAGYNCGYSNDNNPLCATVVTSITATNPTQSITQGGNIVATATAAYLDGSTGTVNCTVSGFNTNTLGSQVITLTYSGFVGNAKTTGTRSCTVNVTVASAKYPTSISVTPSSSSVYNGMEPSYTVIIKYSDNTTNTVTSGYTKTGWSIGAGTKTVIFSYTESSYTVTASVTITVLPNVSSLAVLPSSTSVYNGTEPTYTVVLTYEDGSAKNISAGYSKSGWSAGAGTKTVTFIYTENGITVSKSIVITVLPNITSISVTPSYQTIYRYNNPTFTVTAYYENNTSKTIYTGYLVTGINVNSLGAQTATISYTENNITKTTTATVVVNKLTIICPACGTVYEMDENDTDSGCPVCSNKIVKIIVSPSTVTLYQGQPLSLTVRAVYQNGKMATVSGWTSNYDPLVVGIHEIKVTYLTFTEYITVETIALVKTCPVCTLEYSMNEDGSDPGCPLCSKQVVSINVVEDIVNLERNQPLVLTVIAAYKDGHTTIVTDWTANFVSDTTGTYDVTIYYQSASDHVLVKITDQGWIQCPICGLAYDLTANPNGCPICSTTIVGIEASLRNGGTQVMYKSQLNLKVVLIYKDAHRMITYTGYTITGYQPDKLGTQRVTINYGTFSTVLTVEVIDGSPKAACPKGHEYYLNEDGSDPGCPYCSSTSKDAAIFYFNTTYSADIVSSLYKDGIYYLKEGDYLTVTITQRDVSLRVKLQGMFFGTNKGITHKKLTFGGEVSK